MSARTKGAGPRWQSGFSLIELMIALAIGSVLVVGLIQVFSASRAAYQLSQGIARNQENARFALDFLQRDIRMAGHTGCVNDQSLLSTDAAGNITGGNVRSLFATNDQRDSNDLSAVPFALRFDMGIQGFEAIGTSPANAMAITSTPSAGAAADWSPQLPVEISGLKPIKGSDIVVLRFFSPEQETVTAFTPPTISYADESASTSSKVATQGGGLYAIADCRSASVFQASAPPGNTSMTVNSTGLNKSALGYLGAQDGALAYGANQAWLYRAQSMVYYVALNPDQVPSLYRTQWTTDPGTSAIKPVTEELVEGIESMQLLYGQDSVTAANTPPSGYISTTGSAATIAAAAKPADLWRRVGAVQLGLLVRGTGERAASQQPASLKVLQVSMTPPADGQYRSVYETTIALRNRLFGN